MSLGHCAAFGIKIPFGKLEAKEGYAFLVARRALSFFWNGVGDEAESDTTLSSISVIDVFGGVRMLS